MIVFNESGAQKPGNQLDMYTYRGWNQEQIEQTHRENEGRHNIRNLVDGIRDVRVTDVSSGSVLVGGMVGNDNEKN